MDEARRTCTVCNLLERESIDKLRRERESADPSPDAIRVTPSVIYRWLTFELGYDEITVGKIEYHFEQGHHHANS